MEKIKPYSAVTYTLDYSKNILELREKIVEDEKYILGLDTKNEDQKDYLTNKYIHYRNKHLYYDLILRHEFGKSLLGNWSSKIYEDLYEKGWVMYRQDYSLTPTVHSDIEHAYIDFFHIHFDTYFPTHISLNSKISNNNYQQCRLAYFNQAYYICAQGLFPVIEYLHKVVGKFDGSSIFKIKENFDKTKDQVESITQPFKTNIDFYIKLIDNVNSLIKNHIFSKSIENDEEPIIINRNRLSHGIFTREISKKDCLQLFSIVMVLKGLNDIIEADSRRKLIVEELKKIELSLQKIQKEKKVA